MKIVAPEILAWYRGWKLCQWCGKPHRCDPAHILAKGMGAGGQLDIPANLLSLCRICHRMQHDGHQPLQADLLAMKAAEFGVLQADILAELRRARRLKKGSKYVCPFTAWEWQEQVKPVKPLKKRRA